MLDLNNKDTVLELLKSIIDPEIGLNIVDLGLIYDVKIDENTIEITMTLTTPGCPMHNSITDWVKRVLKMNYPNKEVKVNLVWEPRWTHERMSKEAKEILRF